MSYDLPKMSEIVNGRPTTYQDTALLTALTPEEQEAVLAWIRTSLLPRKKPLRGWTSYGLKHLLDADIGIYLTNNQFKDAMLACGFYPVNEHEVNWYYRISARSPAFNWR